MTGPAPAADSTSSLPLPPRPLRVVILNWNAAADTIAALRQFAPFTRIAPTLIVVDNASVSGDAAAIRAACPQAQVIANPLNQGFSGGSNRGIEAALAANHAAGIDAPILLLNNDALVNEAALLALLRALDEEQDVGVVGPLIYSTGAPPRLQSAGSRNVVLHIHNQLLTPPASRRPVAYISGSVALLRAALLDRIGLLDERYFFNVEVADLCRRAGAAGYRTVVEPAAVVHHNTARSGALRSTLYTYYLIRNRFLFIRTHYRLARRPLALAWAVYGAALAARLRLGGSADAATAVWLGTVDGLRGRFGGQNERILAACAGAGA